MSTDTVIADVVANFKRKIGDPQAVFGLKFHSAWVVGSPNTVRLAASFRTAKNRVLGYERRIPLYVFTDGAIARAVVKALPAALAA